MQAILDQSKGAAPSGVGATGFTDDFIATPGSTSVTTVAPISNCGDTQWSAVQVAGGTQTISSIDGSFTNPGQVVFTTSATSGQGLVMCKGGQAARGSLGNLGGNAGWEINIVAKINQTATCAVRLGVVKATLEASDPATDWIGVEYDTANTGNTDSKFTWVTRAASTPTYSTTNAIAADTSFHHFRIRSVVAGTILFSVDGGAETAVSTNVSTANMCPFVQVITRTAGASAGVVDFYSYSANTGRV